jgi:hypothetical protein
MFSPERLPARLDQAGDLPLPGIVPEADPAHAEAAEKGPRAPAERTAIVLSDLKLIRPFRLDSKTRLSQWFSSRA